MTGKSPLQSIMDKIPESVEDKESVVEWMLDNGIYIHRDSKYLPFNSMCNHMDHVITEKGEELAGHPAHGGWIEQAANNKIFGYLSQCRAIQSGYEFSIKVEKRNNDKI